VRSRIVTIILVVGILMVAVSLVTALMNYRLPGNNKGYRPDQPIAYSHRVHAGEMSIPCLYCHFGAERSRTAAVPSASICMNCHKFVTASLGAVREEERLATEQGRDVQPVVSPELRKLYDALALDETMKRDPSRAEKPIEWLRVHKLPDFVAFDHRPHITAGVACQICHGPVESMDRVRQESNLTMGWCVNCHRESGGTRLAGRPVDPSLDCVTCHY
jgi:hypothetical protein